MNSDTAALLAMSVISPWERTQHSVTDARELARIKLLETPSPARYLDEDILGNFCSIFCHFHCSWFKVKERVIMTPSCGKQSYWMFTLLFQSSSAEITVLLRNNAESDGKLIHRHRKEDRAKWSRTWARPISIFVEWFYHPWHFRSRPYRESSSSACSWQVLIFHVRSWLSIYTKLWLGPHVSRYTVSTDCGCLCLLVSQNLEIRWYQLFIDGNCFCLTLSSLLLH